MTPAAQRWQVVQDLFHAALELVPEQRVPFIRQRVADESTFSEVVSLLEAQARAPEFLNEPAVMPAISSVPEHFGPYRLVRELGHGGMGVVHLARRVDDAFDRWVAIKVVRSSMASEDVMARFRAERKILAQLDHPNIARLLDAGTTPDGSPYFVLEYVEGESLLGFCRERSLNIEQRLNVFLALCGAVEHAHQRLVVHRDLKPSNILVTAEGQPKLLDFGIAKVLEPGEAGDVTGTAQRFFTLRYASPEQLEGRPVTTATDIYALGTLLYELLAQATPFDGDRPNPTELARRVREDEPPKPSSLCPHERDRRLLKGDLDAIVLTALSKAAARRYPSVERLADDLRRHLAGSPVSARPEGGLHRLRKLALRNKFKASLFGVTAVSVVGGSVVSVWQAHIATRERARAEARLTEVRQLANTQLFEFHDAIATLPGAARARALVARRGVEYLARLAREVGDDPTLLRELADGYDRLAAVQAGHSAGNVGDTRGAFESLRQAISFRRRLVAEAPTDRALRSALATSMLSLSDLHETMGNFTAQEEVARDVLEWVDEPGLAARAHRLLARSLANAGHLDAALAELGAERGILEALLKADPSNPQLVFRATQSNHEVAGILSSQGRHDEALERYSQALLALKVLAREYPSDQRYQQAIANANADQAFLLKLLRRYEEASAFAQRAVEIRRMEARSEPKDTDLARVLALSLTQLGDCASVQGQHEAAIAAGEEAVRVASAAVLGDPENVGARQAQAQAQAMLAQILLVADLPDRAQRSAEQAVNGWRELKLDGLLAKGDEEAWRWGEDLLRATVLRTCAPNGALPAEAPGACSVPQ